MSFVDITHDAGQNLFDQILNIYALPYIKKKQDEGILEKPLTLRAVQMVTDPEKEIPEIRVNDEVKWIANVKLKKGVTKNKGDPVTTDDIEGIEGGELFDEEKNFSHITMFLIEDKWLITFNFLSNIPESKRLLSISKEYLRAAKDSHSRKDKYATIGTLFHSCELAARSSMLSFPVVGIKNRGEIRKHNKVNERYIGFSKLFVEHAEGSTILSKLMNLRNDARYGKEDITLSHDTISEYIEAVERLINSEENNS